MEGHISSLLSPLPKKQILSAPSPLFLSQPKISSPHPPPPPPPIPKMRGPDTMKRMHFMQIDNIH